MSETEDRRTRRTRTALRASLMSLMTEKGYDAVTVQDVIDRADVGRSTFYAHYTDKNDLLDDLLVGLWGLLMPAAITDAPDPRRPLRFSLEMLRHVSDQRALLLGLLGPEQGGPVIRQVENMLIEVVRGELQQLAAGHGALGVPIDLLAASVVASFLAVLRWWVDTDFTRTPEQMDAFYQAMVAPGVRGLMKASAAPLAPPA
jgi:AcrR family transcriptional regulator